MKTMCIANSTTISDTISASIGRTAMVESDSVPLLSVRTEVPCICICGKKCGWVYNCFLGQVHFQVLLLMKLC